jgi:hypothetical protein
MAAVRGTGSRAGTPHAPSSIYPPLCGLVWLANLDGAPEHLFTFFRAPRCKSAAIQFCHRQRSSSRQDTESRPHGTFRWHLLVPMPCKAPGRSPQRLLGGLPHILPALSPSARACDGLRRAHPITVGGLLPPQSFRSPPGGCTPAYATPLRRPRPAAHSGPGSVTRLEVMRREWVEGPGKTYKDARDAVQV